MKKLILIFVVAVICLGCFIGCKTDNPKTGSVRIVSASFTNKPDFVSVSSLEIVILDKDGKKLASSKGSVVGNSFVEVSGLEEGSYNYEINCFDSAGIFIFKYEAPEKVSVEKEETTVLEAGVTFGTEKPISYFFYATKNGKLQARNYISSACKSDFTAAVKSDSYFADGKIKLEKIYTDCFTQLYPEDKKVELKTIGVLKLSVLDDSAITGVDLPDYEIVIEDNAFAGFSVLKSIDLSNASNIGNSAFKGCTSLVSVTLPEDLPVIRDNAFNGCSSLETIGNLDKVQFIGKNAFNGCKKLAVGNTLKLNSIGDGAFKGCEAINVATVECSVIGNNAFEGCKGLTSLTLKGNLKRIPSGCFAECTNLASITMPDGVEEIKSNSFKKCKFAVLTIPKTVKSIDSCAFESCNSLSTVYIPESVDEIKYNAFKNCGTVTFNYQGSVIPDSWDSLWYGLGTTVELKTGVKAN